MWFVNYFVFVFINCYNDINKIVVSQFVFFFQCVFSYIQSGCFIDVNWTVFNFFSCWNNLVVNYIEYLINFRNKNVVFINIIMYSVFIMSYIYFIFIMVWYKEFGFSQLEDFIMFMFVSVVRSV